MSVKDKTDIYKAIYLAKAIDTSSMDASDEEAKKLRLGSLRGHLPMVWFPRHPTIKACVHRDFKVDCIIAVFCADADTARANVASEKPVPYLGLTYSDKHSAWCAKVVDNDLMHMMVDSEHQSHDAEAREMIQKLHPGIIEDSEAGNFKSFWY